MLRYQRGLCSRSEHVCPVPQLQAPFHCEGNYSLRAHFPESLTAGNPGGWGALEGGVTIRRKWSRIAWPWFSHQGHKRACLWERGVLGCPTVLLSLSPASSPTTRFLVKIYMQAQASPDSTSQRSLPQSVAYLITPGLDRCPAQRAADFLHPELYTMAWAHVAVR